MSKLQVFFVLEGVCSEAGFSILATIFSGHADIKLALLCVVEVAL